MFFSTFCVLLLPFHGHCLQICSLVIHPKFFQRSIVSFFLLSCDSVLISFVTDCFWLHSHYVRILCLLCETGCISEMVESRIDCIISLHNSSNRKTTVCSFTLNDAVWSSVVQLLTFGWFTRLVTLRSNFISAIAMNNA